MGCSSSVATRTSSESPAKDASNGKVKSHSVKQDIGQVPELILEPQSLEVTNDNFKETNSNSLDSQTLHSTDVSSLRVLHGRSDKGDGISTQSLNSKLTIEENVKAEGYSSSYQLEEPGTSGQRDAAMSEAQIILDKALKELSQSLFESSELSGSKSLAGTPIMQPRRDNTLDGVRATASPALSGDSTLSEDGIKIAVIDAGSGFCKAGFSGEDIPSVVIPTVVGRQKKDGLIPGIDVNEAFIGKDAKLRREALQFTRPVHKGVVTNWDDMEKVYGHILHMELNLEENDHGVVLPTCAFTARKDRETLTQIMFETFQSKKLYMGSSAPLALHALGLTTGLVVSLGHGVSYAAPIIQGNTVSDAIRVTKLGNEDIIKQVNTVLQGMNIQNLDEDISRSIVEKMCYVSKDYAADMQADAKSINKEYTLPNGQIARLGKERFSCSEILFNPSLIRGSNETSLVDVCREALESAAKIDPDRARDLRRNIVLVGGTSLMPGVSDRLKSELLTANAEEPTCVLALPGRQYASWRGASMLTSLMSSRNRWIDKLQYEEHGPSIIHRKYV